MPHCRCTHGKASFGIYVEEMSLANKFAYAYGIWARARIVGASMQVPIGKCYARVAEPVSSNMPELAYNALKKLEFEIVRSKSEKRARILPTQKSVSEELSSAYHPVLEKDQGNICSTWDLPEMISSLVLALQHTQARLEKVETRLNGFKFTEKKNVFRNGQIYTHREPLIPGARPCADDNTEYHEHEL
mgnify:CR=1 FL=1